MFRWMRYVCVALAFVWMVDGSFGCTPEPKAEGSGETAKEQGALEPDTTAEITKEPGAPEPRPEPQPEPAPEPKPEPRPEPRQEVSPEPTTDAGPTEGTDREATPETTSEEPTSEPSTEPSTEGQKTHFSFLGQTIKFTDPNQGPYEGVKVCAHASITDVSLGKPLTGTTCTVSPKDGKYTINAIPYATVVYISFRSNGPNSPSKGLLPTVLAIRVIRGEEEKYLVRLRTELIDESESTLVAQLLNVKLDLSQYGVLVTDAHTQRVQTVTGVQMALHPTQPSSVTGPIYMPETLPGTPSTTGTTKAGIALFLNVPPGKYSVSYNKQGVQACRAYPTSPATTTPCQQGATAGVNDCSSMDVLAGWLSITSGTCP